MLHTSCSVRERHPFLAAGGWIVFAIRACSQAFGWATEEGSARRDGPSPQKMEERSVHTDRAVRCRGRRGGWRQCCYVAQAAQAAVRYTLAALRRPSPTPAPDRSWSELGRFLACGCALRSFDVTSGTSLSLKEKKLALFHTRIMLFIVPT
jgi:hypothetical protein